MGERGQPVTGMRSCRELEDAGSWAGGEGWRAREWFVVRAAELRAAEGGALVPSVEMGVEAREMTRGPRGLEDAALTRPDHPLVRYAEDFTRHFDLIAERQSAVHSLRELAKASVLAKFLLESGIEVDEAWFRPAEGEGSARGPAKVPQLWNERSHSQVCVEDGRIVTAGMQSGTTVHGVYGGVSLSLDAWGVSKKVLQPLTTASWFPKGVDLGLDGFELSAPAGAAQEASSDVLPCGRLFWSGIDGGAKPGLQGEQKTFLGELFRPLLTDRREEGDKFTPPDTRPAYVDRLEASLREEREARQRREEHFLGGAFDVGAPGPLFPSTWTAPSPGQLAKPAAPRPELRTEALCLLMQRPPPLLDCAAEDGARFRVYRAGGLELRTVQEPAGAERLGAVFALGAPPEPSPAPPAPQAQEPQDDDYADLCYAI